MALTCYTCFWWWQKKFDVQFKEAECYKIDTVNKKVHCRSTQQSSSGGTEEFTVDYDYLVVGMGARVNTFNTPGVVEHAHFLKVILLAIYNVVKLDKILCKK